MKALLNNLSIHYSQYGNDHSLHTLLFLHDWNSDSTCFLPLIALLEKDCNIYTIDLPGFGNSEKPCLSYKMDQYENVIVEFIHLLKLENVTLIGHSFSGNIILSLVEKNKYIPQQVIILNGVQLLYRQRFFYFTENFLQTSIRGKTLSPCIMKYTFKTLKNEKIKGKEGRKSYHQVMKSNIFKKCSTISIPVLLLHGEQDQKVSMLDAKMVESKIKDCTLIFLKNAGHYCFLDDLNTSYLHIRNFVL